MLLGYSRGKVGDVVFQRLKGQQITKARNRNPNNPRTYAQMGQRVRLASCVDFYKRNTAFFPFAFQDKTEKESEYNAFTRANIMLSPFMTKEQVTNGVVIPAPWIMTNGELTEYPLTYDQDYEEEDQQVISYAFAENVECDETLSNPLDNLAQILSEGDMLTLYFYSVDVVSSSQIYTRGYLQYTLSNGEIVEKRDNPYISFDLRLVGSKHIGFNVAIALPKSVAGSSLDAAVGLCAVISRKSGSRILVSPSRLVLNDSARVAYFTYRQPHWLNYCCESYGEISSALLDPSDASKFGAAVVPVSLSLDAPDFGIVPLAQNPRLYVTPENLTAAEAVIKLYYTFTVGASQSQGYALAKYGTYYPDPTYKITLPTDCTKVEIKAQVYSDNGGRAAFLLFTKNFTFTQP